MTKIMWVFKQLFHLETQKQTQQDFFLAIIETTPIKIQMKILKSFLKYFKQIFFHSKDYIYRRRITGIGIETSARCTIRTSVSQFCIIWYKF